MKLGIIANINRPHAKSVVERAMRWCRERGQEFYLSESLTSIIKNESPILPEVELSRNCDYLLAMGGDGTILATARLVGKSQVPILGINIGSLGFLTEQTPADLESSLERLQKGNYLVEERLVLEASIDGDADGRKFHALNDIVIDKGSVSRIITLSLSVNGDYICSYNADGLIISTPTGSTAYALAVGGPILNPVMKAIIAAPIAPHSLALRTLIFPPHDVLEVTAEFCHDFAIVTADGQINTSLPMGAMAKIRVADHVVKLIRFPENSFYSVLRSKLHWGMLPKGPDGK